MDNTIINEKKTTYTSTGLNLFEEKALRIMDFTIALTALIVFSPVMLVIAMIIRMDSPGPVIFRQVRIGKDRRNGSNGKKLSVDARSKDLGGKPFVFYKFRTMYVDAKERFPELYRYEYSDKEIKKLYFKHAGDPRLTRLGEKLRKTTIDELPNFINVIKGEMSLVGPRPDIPEMIKYYEDWQRKKFTVKPGITGLAQINGRGLLSFQETLKLDVKMVKKYGLWFNTKVMFRTFKIIVFSIGAF